MIRLSGVSGDTSSSRRSDDDADQVAPLVDDVEIEDHLDVAVALQLGDGLADRHVFAQREDMRVHDAAGGLLGVLEQVLDHARFLRAHQVEDRGRQLLGQVVDQRRRVVGRDLLRELGDLLGRARRPAARRPLRARARRRPPSPGGRCARRAALNAASRSLSGSSLKICARSAGCCFCSRFSRLAVAPMRSSRLTESRTRSILRCAAIDSYRSVPRRIVAATVK